MNIYLRNRAFTCVIESIEDVIRNTSSTLNNYFQDISYGEGINTLYIGTIYDPSYFKYSTNVSNKYSKKRKTFDYLITLDSEKIMKADKYEIRNMLYEGIISSLKIIKKKKIPGFDLEQFRKDLEKCFNERILIVPSDNVVRLMEAVKSGEIEVVYELIKSGTDINVKDDFGMGALLYAIETSNGKMVELLIGNGADVNATDNHNTSVLMKAIFAEDVCIARIITKAGAKVNIKNISGESAFSWAIGWRRPDIMNLIIFNSTEEFDTNIEDGEYSGIDSKFFKAIKNGGIKDVKNLIKEGADVNQEEGFGMTPLMWASNMERADIVKLLIDNGAKVNATCYYGGGTALIMTCSEEVAKVLMENGADINIRDNRGKSALDVAKKIGATALVDLLFKSGADTTLIHTEESLIELKVLSKEIITLSAGSMQEPGSDVEYIKEKQRKDIEKFRQLVEKSLAANKLSKESADKMVSDLVTTYEKVSMKDTSPGATFMNAIYGGDISKIRKLIKEGADVNEKDVDGMSALMSTIRNLCDIDIVKLLIANGADLNATTDNGSTALMFASIEEEINIVKALIKSGADVNIQNNDGENALMWAIMDSRPEAEKLLVKSGTDLNARDKNGRNVLMMIGDEEFAELIIKKGADVNVKDNDGRTALMNAKAFGNKYLVDLLMKAGANDK
ncbi:ankyrin repeat domain-containing protein [Thermodesulfobacteriota bacterium]